MPSESATTGATPKKITPTTRDTSALHPTLHVQLKKDVWQTLIFWRILNFLCLATFFQPDEYFQLQEPAWQLAFGQESNAWLTWEWQHQLRSSLHPVLFSAFYYAVQQLLWLVHAFPQFQAVVLQKTPNAAQAMFAVVGDFYAWRLAEKIYGQGSNTAWVVHLMNLSSPWAWYVCTRTFSNSLETVLTIVALYYWPWSLVSDDLPLQVDAYGSEEVRPSRVFGSIKSVLELRLSLILAGFACLLRPTNLLIWAAVAMLSVTRIGTSGNTKAVREDYYLLVREVLLCGYLDLAISAATDYYYYGAATFPPFQWLHYNLTHNLAVFYGTNNWHYYITQGFPLLLTTYLPFFLLSLINPSISPSHAITNIRQILLYAILTTAGTLSLVTHKETRFISPLLPLLHILAAPHALAFFSDTTTIQALTPTRFTRDFTLKHSRKPYVVLLATINILIALYGTLAHQRGVIAVLPYLRGEYAAQHLSNRGLTILDTTPGSNDAWPPTHVFSQDEYSQSASALNSSHQDQPFAAFLMPCHSTPWRTHLHYPSLQAWALTCEPPLHIPAEDNAARAAYRDEADRFYDDPIGFLRREISVGGQTDVGGGYREVGHARRQWPRYIVGFEGIETVLREFVEGQRGLGEGLVVVRKKEFWNGFFNEDTRRRGKVVVWEFVSQ